MPSDPADLPVAQVLPAIRESLTAGAAVVLQAPPGAGKTTLVPLALAEDTWADDGRVVVLEPRRVAARAAAQRMAFLHGSRLGGHVGYTTGEDARTSHATRVEVVTEGVLVARLLRDPSLPGVAAVVLDEFHERSVDADLALAFTLEAAQVVRPDLRVAVMSATLEAERVGRVLEAAGLRADGHRSDGRVHPVETVNREPPTGGDPVHAVVAAAHAVLDEHDGDVLAFLPGEREIRGALALLADLPHRGVDVVPLYGRLAPSVQRQALEPSPPRRRRIVVATDIAESSLTVPGVRIVIDAGLVRRPRMDPVSGMTRLETVRVSRASADQRRGRAAREGPGLCIRLWSPRERLVEHTPAAILEEDLAPAALAVAAWGTPVQDLPLIDPPPAATWAAARDLLRLLGALGRDGRVTEHGRVMAVLPLHPRLAHMVLQVPDARRALAIDTAALLAERDVLLDAGSDLADRIDVLHGRAAGRHRVRHDALDRVRRQARRLRRRLGVAHTRRPSREEADRHLGGIVLQAYPDRVAQRRGDRRGTFLMARGRGGVLPDGDALAGERFLAVAHVDRGQVDARIFLAAALDEADVAPLTVTEDVVEWGAPSGGETPDVLAERRRRLGALVVSRAPLPQPPPDQIRAALLEGVRLEGLRLLGWTAEDRELRARLAFLQRVRPAAERWPAVDDETLLAELDTWLGPFLLQERRREDLARRSPGPMLRARVPATRQQDIDALAPTHLLVPSGRRARVRYDEGDQPVLAVKLQEMFGATVTPTIAGVPVLVHLLSPAGRPLQITADLLAFWQGSYAQVRAEMRGRYPKHPWPEDPLAATPTRRTTRRLRG